MTADGAPIAGKLSRLGRLRSSDRDGEVIAAVRAIDRTLRAAGADIHALADRIEQANGGGKLTEVEMRKLYDAGFLAAEERQHGINDFRNTDGMPQWHEIAKFCQRHHERLCTREQEFIDSVAAHPVYRQPTEKQAKWIEAIFLRLGGRLS
jgi:hypothetical protein